MDGGGARAPWLPGRRSAWGWRRWTQSLPRPLACKSGPVRWCVTGYCQLAFSLLATLLRSAQSDRLRATPPAPRAASV
eukprot:6033477-Prymnesium_polylepis.1